MAARGGDGATVKTLISDLVRLDGRDEVRGPNEEAWATALPLASTPRLSTLLPLPDPPSFSLALSHLNRRHAFIQDGDTAAKYVALNGQLDCLRELLNAGADKDAANKVQGGG